MGIFKIGDSCKSLQPNTIIQQQYYCEQKCNKDIFDYDLPKFFYILIKDGKYLGVLPNKQDAEFLAEWEQDYYCFET